MVMVIVNLPHMDVTAASGVKEISSRKMQASHFFPISTVEVGGISSIFSGWRGYYGGSI
jgi:hypothetical protein